MAVTVFMRYQIDPFQRAEFGAYARRWPDIIPQCAGDVAGYRPPHEGTNSIVCGRIAFASLAAFGARRMPLKSDPTERQISNSPKRKDLSWARYAGS